MTQLAASDIHISFGNKSVLRGVSASFTHGQVTAIIGPTGSVKSTLLSCLAVFRKHDQ